MSKYILSIDAGTTGITILLFNHSGEVVRKEYSEFTQIFPKPGWVEHNPEEIWDVTKNLIKSILNKYNHNDICSIGITNQRETTVLWDKNDSKPIYNAIVWQCKRTQKFCANLIKSGHADNIKSRTGLIVDSYFSASKINWIINNVEKAKKLIASNDLLFGTIDTWLIWKLTNGKGHFTDHTNASRTMIYNIDKQNWDKALLDIFSIPSSFLPQILNSCDDYGITSKESIGCNIHINGVAGDQQSALFGQNGFNTYDAKCTYGTGCFLLINTGTERKNSNKGLLTTIGIDSKGKPCYAIEGSVFIGGAVVQWLRDGLKLLNNASETEKIAKSIKSSNGVYIVPAFTGLGTPYWDMEARGLITGITRGTNKSHLVRAALESIAYQVYDIIITVKNELGINISTLKVDGGATQNNFLMQFQSDILGINIERPNNIESTSIGAALLAGIESKFWEINHINSFRSLDKEFKSKISNQSRNILLEGWSKAINKTIN